MKFFDKALRATVMTTELFINSNVSKKILYECLEIAQDFERKYSAYQEDSLLSKINRASGIEPIVCTEEELKIFEEALKIARLSKGKFDPTIGALTQALYGFGTEAQKIPKESELREQKKLVDYSCVEINECHIYLQKKGMRLDLGAIGKGYVADKIMEYLIDRGATRALVSVGGEICSFGKEYTIAVRDPFSGNNFVFIKSSKKPLTLSTSGDYERYIGTKDHHHILDTTSAKQSHFYSSVTLLSNGIDASKLDAVATIVFNSPREELYDLAMQFNVAILAVTREKGIIFENFSNIDIKNFSMAPFESENITKE